MEQTSKPFYEIAGEINLAISLIAIDAYWANPNWLEAFRTFVELPIVEGGV